MARVGRYRSGLHLLDEGDEAGEALFAGGLVAGDGVVGVFASAHESVACTFIGDGIVLFAGDLHGFGRGGDGGTDAGVIAGVKAVDGSGNGGDVGWAGAIEDEGGREVFAMCCEGEGLAATPAKADRGDLAIARRELFSVVGCGVEVGVDDCRIEARDGFDGIILRCKGGGTAPVGAEAGEEIGCDDDEALSREFVCHLFGPVAKAEDLMDEDDDRCFGFDLGIDDECLDGAITMLEGDVFVVAGRGVEAGFGPVLSLSGGDGEGEEQSCGEKLKRARHGKHHGEECSTWY